MEFPWPTTAFDSNRMSKPKLRCRKRNVLNIIEYESSVYSQSHWIVVCGRKIVDCSYNQGSTNSLETDFNEQL